MSLLRADNTGARWLRNTMRILALGLGAAHTTVAVLRQSMNEDGIDYLDMGTAYLRGDWEMALNGIWSPLYSWILGAVIHLFEPTIRWEFPAAQITNFFIYATAMFCFEYFWRQLTARYHSHMAAEPDVVGFHPGLFLVLGYSLFIWSSLNLIEIWAVNPDMSVAALAYLAAGLMLRLSGPAASASAAVLLGVVLGVGYLTKAAMMPLAIVCLLLTLALPDRPLGRVRRLALSASTFLIVAAPFLVALSMDYGTPTFSDVGRFTYLKHVNEMPYPNFHPELNRLAGIPEHPPRRVFDDPPVYEFAEPIGGTYPMSYDPSYWTAGLRPTVTLAQQLRALATNAMAYFDLFVRTQGGFLAVVVILGLMSLSPPLRPKSISAELTLAVWALAALGLYSLVHVTPRYIAPFVVLFWAGWLGMIRLPDLPHCRRLIHAGAALLVSFVWINIAALNLEGLGAMIGFSPLSESGAQPGQFSDAHKSDHPAIAEGLLAQGLEQGDHVGFIGYSFSAFWARLARLRIVAEIHSVDLATFWQADAEHQREILRAFAGTGAVAVIAEPIESRALPSGWVKIGQTDYLLYLFR